MPDRTCLRIVRRVSIAAFILLLTAAGVFPRAMAAEPAPIRVPREIKRVVLADDGPLVLVETRKDLSQLKLPFEQGAARQI